MKPDDLLNLFQSITTKLIDKYAPVKKKQQDGCVIQMFGLMKSVDRIRKERGDWSVCTRLKVKHVLMATGKLGILEGMSLTSYSKLQSQSIGEIKSEQANPRQLWKSLGILTGDKCVKIDSGHSAEEFVFFFEEKVDKIRLSTSSASPPCDTKQNKNSNMLSLLIE